MRVLLTGAFGNLGRSTMHALLGEGHEVVAFDLPTRANRRHAARVPDGVEVTLGDVTRSEDVRRVMRGVDAVIHDAAVLPPTTERQPELARRVNVGGTMLLIEAAEAERRNLPFVFASSYTVFGPRDPRSPFAHADDPIVATDVYTETKLACEARLRASSLSWVILRLAAAIEGAAQVTDTIALRMLFEVREDSPVELVHGKDVASAQARAVSTAAAYRRVLLIGGGQRCRTTNRGLVELALAPLGLGSLPREAFGSAAYYTCFLDTEESQRLLDYQGHDLAAIGQDMSRRIGSLRPVLRVFAPLMRRVLLSFSGPFRKAPAHPSWKALIDAGY
jgi:nucleoside-diphosphate-sugar epimerase